MSYAGSVSAASDVTFAGFNPAALRVVETREIGQNFSLIFPRADGRTTTSTVPADTLAALGISTETNADRSAAVPAFAFGWRYDPDIVLGLTVNAPFGLATENPDNFIGAADGTQSSLLTIQVSPMASVDVTDYLTLGGAIDFLYVDARLGSAVVNLDGNDLQVGFSAGALLDVGPRTTIGVAYHHGFDLSVSGTAQFTDAGAPAAGLAGQFIPTVVNADLPLVGQVGITHGFTEDFRMSAEFRYINWSVFESIDTSIESLGIDASDPQNYEDSVFAAIGAEYDFTPAFTGRIGFAYDQTPTQDTVSLTDAGRGRTVRVPDEDRLWLSIGASMDMELFGFDTTLDAAYSFLYALKDPEVTVFGGPFAGSTIEYDAGAHIFSLGGTVRF